jgi:hypothetical protein
MPLVFIFVALLFWATVATVVALGRLSRDTVRWVASLGHRGPRGTAGPGRAVPHR